MTAKARLAWTLVAFISVVASGLMLVHLLEQQRQTDRRATVAPIVEARAHALQRQLDRSLSAAHTLASVFRQYKRIERFDELAADILATFEGVSGLYLAPAGVVSAAYSSGSEPDWMGIEFLRWPATAAAAQAAVDGGELAVAGPFERDGELVLLGLLPVFLPDDTGRERLWGLMATSLYVSELLQFAELPSLRVQGYAYELAYTGPGGGGTRVLARSAGGPGVAPVQSELDLPNGTWTLSVAPRGGWGLPGTLWLEGGLVLLAGLLVAALVQFWLRQPALLRAQVAARTRELARANRALRESEGLYRSLARNIPDSAVMLFDRDLRFTLAEGPALAQQGFHQERMLGKTLWEVLPAESADELAVMYRSALAGKSHTTERSYGGRHYLGRILPVRDETGGIYVGMVMSQDITARKGAEEALERQLRRVRKLYEISARTDSIERQIEATLEVGVDELASDLAIVSHIEATDYVVQFVHAAAGGLARGEVFELGDTYCSLTLDADDVVTVDHMARSPHRNHPCYQRFKLESYIGSPLWVDGARYGTLSFSGAAPRGAPFDASDKQFVQLMSRWVGTMLERKRAADERRRFISLVENSSEFIGMASLDGRATFLNQAGRDLVGLPSEADVTGTALEDLCTAQTRAKLRDEALPSALRQGAWHGEGRLRHTRTGAPVEVEMTVFLVRDPETDAPLCLATVQRDIGERKRVERERRLMLSVSQTIKDADNLHALARGTLLELKGVLGADHLLLALYEPERNALAHFVSLGLPERFMDRVRDQKLDEAGPGIARQTVLRDETIVVGGGDDTEQGRHARALFAPHGFGQIVSIALRAEFQLQGVLQVVTRPERALSERETRLLHQVANELALGIRRLRAERALAASEREYRDLVENANDAIYTLDREGRFTSFNRRAERLTGFARDELLGRPYHALLPERERLRARRAFARNLRGEAVTFELRVRRRNGSTLEMELSTRPLVGEGGVVGVQGIARDVSERKRLERLKDEFVSNVSHELRTPLTSIKGFADLLLAERCGPLNDPQREYLNRLSRNTKRLTELINDVLDLQRLESGQAAFEFSPVPLKPLLEEVYETYAMGARDQGLAFELELGERLSVSGEANRLSQAFGNLVSNAIKYTDAGRIGLRAAAEPEGEEIVVEVWDTGIGVSAEERAQLFERFYRAPSAQARGIGGTGLGLSIVKQTVEAHGGRIEVRSGPAGGAAFRVYLPALRGTEAADGAT